MSSTVGAGHSSGAPGAGAGDARGIRASGAARIGGYRLCSELGRGGMGIVHLALDDHGRAVALKLLRDHVLDDPGARARLAREVDHLSRIRHPGVAGIVAADVTGPRPYVVMRYVPGPSLDRYVDQHGPLPPEALWSLAKDLSEALSAVHAMGVVHRDLKPANVLLHDGRPVLIDFGIAHGADDARITSTGLVMGTPGFLAPEILDGAGVTEATDWWAWAATLAFAASGRVPFGDGPIEAVLTRIRAGQADLTGVDPRLAPLLRAALDPRPAGRPTQRQILAELERYAAGGIPTESIPTVPTTEVIPAVPRTSPVPVVPDPPPRPSVAPSFGSGPSSESPPSWGPSSSPVGDGHSASPGWPAPAAAYASFRDPGHGGPAAYDAMPPGSPASAPAGRQPVTAPPVAGPTPPTSPPPRPRGRRTGVILALGALLAALTLVAPVAALCAGVAWSWIARTVERAAVGLQLRRGEFGPRRGDVAGAVLRTPAYALGAALGSIFGAILPALAGASAVAGAIALQGPGGVPGAASDPSSAAPLLAGAAAAMIVGWWGPGGSTVRRGTRVVVRSLTPGRAGATILAGVVILAAAAIALVSQSSGFEPSWIPLTEDPFGWVRGLASQGPPSLRGR